MLFTIFLKKYLKEQYGKDVTKSTLKKAPAIYRDMLDKCDDIGSDNPMAGNIYMCFVFLAVWKAADGAIDPESYRTVVNKFMRSGIVSKFMGGKDINNPDDFKKMKDKFHAMQDWADAHPEYKEKTWDFNFDDKKHRDGSYYHFTRCPLNNFAREYGFLEVLPICCDIDYITTEYSHGVLYRDYTLASGGDICDYWIVPDKVENPE
ncbi:L-2-amino-thiazoline-4-carboxylic acid hydrolase [Dialister invisus]|nr:L-2-amino-thiazoline-4-carboxylic acid hydrolase [Dialister invisus]